MRQGAAPTIIRRGSAADAGALYELIRAHQEEGHLLPRDRDELSRRASRFVVATAGRRLIGCAELAALSPAVAEIRSLVVRREARGEGVAGRLVSALRQHAVDDRFRTLCAFAHDAGFFIRHGFSIVPHVWVPEKIAHDCAGCPLFRQCGQHAMLLSLEESVSHGTKVVADRRARVA
jgi:amino-acid N-acetyltransferase